jgi:methionyl-tRNA formyltransferase
VLPGAAVENSTFAEWIELNGVDILLNVHSLHILHPDVVRAPRIGSFNLHPGPLPRYAGLMAPSWALFNGESSHAVTLHWMEQGIDTGPVAYESPFPISSSDTGLSVSLRCVKHGIPLIRRLLDAATNSPDSIPLIPQDVKGRRYFGQRPPNGGCVTWASSARELVDFVRACDYLPFRSPWGHPKARLGNRELLILKAGRTFESAHQEPGVVRSVEAETAIVASSDEWIRVDRVQIGGESLRAADVLEPGNQLLDGAISAG